MKLWWLFLLVSFSGWGQSITWLADAAPGFDKQVRLDEQTRDLILQDLPDLQVRIEVSNPQRAIKLLAQRDDICVGDRIYTPARQEFSVATQLPQAVVLGLRLYVRDTAARFPQILHKATTQGLSIVDLLTEQGAAFKLGIVEGRSYGGAVDQALRPFLTSDLLYRRAGTDMGAGVIAMLRSERIDALLEFPNIYQLYAGQSGQTTSQSFSLKETPAYNIGFILCSNSETGRYAAGVLSKRIAVLSQTSAYLQSHLNWFDVSLHAELTRYYDKVYGTTFSSQPSVSYAR
ncbi:hypothetical protein [Bowmanella denitrificans]|uniref:hypothetical protein n=1 Tax=Bowmanella denitrificans TaxID=366582 RepID=UPI0031DB645B